MNYYSFYFSFYENCHIIKYVQVDSQFYEFLDWLTVDDIPIVASKMKQKLIFDCLEIEKSEFNVGFQMLKGDCCSFENFELKLSDCCLDRYLIKGKSYHSKTNVIMDFANILDYFEWIQKPIEKYDAFKFELQQYIANFEKCLLIINADLNKFTCCFLLFIGYLDSDNR